MTLQEVEQRIATGDLLNAAVWIGGQPAGPKWTGGNVGRYVRLAHIPKADRQTVDIPRPLAATVPWPSLPETVNLAVYRAIQDGHPDVAYALARLLARRHVADRDRRKPAETIRRERLMLRIRERCSASILLHVSELWRYRVNRSTGYRREI